MATVNLDCKLDLKTIAFHARNVEYNPKVGNPKNGGGFFLHQAEFFPLDCETPPRAPNSRRPRFSHSAQRFAAAIMRIRSPKTTALIFSSGKMVCTGAKTEALAREAARKYAKVISKLGFPAQFKVRIRDQSRRARRSFDSSMHPPPFANTGLTVAANMRVRR